MSMTYVADLHLHSSYAYATSRAITLDSQVFWAKLKGIDLLASADFTHPAWFKELREALVEVSPGLYEYGGIQFVLGTEASCIFRQGERRRQIHLLVFAPGFEAAERLNVALAPYGNLERDGRPTLSLSVRDLTALALEVDPDCLVIPAHVWTPWFGVYGSRSGLDSLAAAFDDMFPQIHAVETGLSSDPEMNWAVPDLSGKTLVSFSDAHSSPKLAREATVFDGELTYAGLAQALRFNRVAYTVEFYPEEGKYHYDGHRKCGVCQHPEVTDRQGSKCRVCGRELTRGVLNRTRLLSSSDSAMEVVTGVIPPTTSGVRLPSGFVGFPEGTPAKESRPPFIRLIPLPEIIATVMRQGPNTKRVQTEYRRILAEFGADYGGELEVLTRSGQADLERVAGPETAQAILRARTGDIYIEPGYDGVFGKVSLTRPVDR